VRTSPDLNEALKQFDAVQANLHKLDRLWESLDKMLPSGNEMGFTASADEYRDLVRKFIFIAEKMPKIDGFGLTWEFSEPDTIMGNHVDYAELGHEAPLGVITYNESLREPGDRLKEYRFRLANARRKLARDTVGSSIAKIDELLVRLVAHGSDKDPNYPMEQSGDDWEQLKHTVDSIDAVGPVIVFVSGWQKVSY